MEISEKEQQRSPLYSENNLIWMDLEMTGLEPQINRILEMAAVVTDSQLNVIAESPIVPIHQSDAVLNAMDSWNTTHHTKSGLVDRVKASTTDEAMAEQLFIDFFAQYVPAGKSPLCGNSIHQDRRFMNRWMPRLERFFYYRNIDVSSIKELVRRWDAAILLNYQKETKHEALADIYDSINELKFYRENVMKI